MSSKTYEFSYGGNIKKFLSKTVSLIYNSIIGGIVLFVFMFLISEINYRLKFLVNDDTFHVFKIIEILLGIAILSVFIIPSFFQQKVEISEKMIKVYRHCLFFSIFMIRRGFNDTILISQIKEVYRPTCKDKFFQPIPVNVIDWDNMVIIKLNNSLETIYYIPVKDSENFITEVNRKIEKLNSSSQS